MRIKATDAVIVVDVQRDFCAGGALAVPGGDAVVPVINGIVPRFTHMVFSRDWHPVDHCSFGDPPAFVDGSWPAHCVQNTPGAAFHPDLVVPEAVLIISKATEATPERYSAFDRTTLEDDFRQRDVVRVFVCGLATDYCVRATALDAVRCGFQTVLIEDACRGVDVPPGSAALAVEAMKHAGVATCLSGDLE